MTTRSKVAVLRTQPETVLPDYEHLLELAEVLLETGGVVFARGCVQR